MLNGALIETGERLKRALGEGAFTVVAWFARTELPRLRAVRAGRGRTGATTYRTVPGTSSVRGARLTARPGPPAPPSAFTTKVSVVPAMARRKLNDPVFVLAGGPGQSAIRLAPSVLPPREPSPTIGRRSQFSSTSAGPA